MLDKSDSELATFLQGADTDTVVALADLMRTVLSRDAKELAEVVHTAVPPAGSDERFALADSMVRQLRYFGSDSIAYLARSAFADEPGVHYYEILHDVVKLLNKQVKKNKISIPRVASVRDYEELLCETLLRVQFQGKTEAEIAQMLIEAGLEKDAALAAAEGVAKWGTGGAGVVGLVKLLGKRAVKDIIQRIVVWVVAKKIGRDAAEKLAERLLKGVAQRTIAAFLSGVGWALIAWDVISLASPATRITLPCVALIATSRTMHRYASSPDET